MKQAHRGKGEVKRHVLPIHNHAREPRPRRPARCIPQPDRLPRCETPPLMEFSAASGNTFPPWTWKKVRSRLPFSAAFPRLDPKVDPCPSLPLAACNHWFAESHNDPSLRGVRLRPLVLLFRCSPSPNERRPAQAPRQKRRQLPDSNLILPHTEGGGDRGARRKPPCLRCDLIG